VLEKTLFLCFKNGLPNLFRDSNQSYSQNYGYIPRGVPDLQ